MTTYVDSSVLLRIILSAPGALHGWKSLEGMVSSALLEVECLRTLDRLRIAGNIAAEEIGLRREAVYDAAARMDIIEISAAVLTRASQPLPLPLKTLDAIHLASAMLWREAEDQEIAIATHDAALGMAARALGFRVIGI